MRAFDLECFDYPVQADFDNEVLDSIQSIKLQLQICREEKQNLRDELKEQFENYVRLKKQYDDLLGRLDWRLLMRINRLPGVARIKRLLRPLASRILRL